MSNTMLKANLRNPEFISAIKDLKEGDSIETSDGILIVEALFTRPTHLLFSQRIFAPGMILKKSDRPLRIYVPAALIGLAEEVVEPGEFDDRQIVNGEVLPPDPEVQAKEEIII